MEEPGKGWMLISKDVNSPEFIFSTRE